MKKVIPAALVMSLMLTGCGGSERVAKPAESDMPTITHEEATRTATEAATEVETQEVVKETMAETLPESEMKREVVNTMSDEAILELYKKGVDRSANWCFSPYSLLDCMSIIALDVQGNTKSEYKKLGIADWQFFAEYDKNPPSGLNISNRGYINETRIGATNTDYVRPDCEIETLKFDDAAVQHINENASKDTNEKITSILNSLDPDTPSCFVNAVYFNNKWDWEEEDIYWKKEYESRPGFGGDLDADCVKELSPKIDMVRLVYPDTDFAMYVIVPQYDEEVEELDTFMENEFSFDMLSSNPSPEWSEANFYMPSFEFSSMPAVQDALEASGINIIFSDVADFGRLGDLHIGNIIQKTYIKVNNKGTEAAAVTAMVMCDNALVMPEPVKSVLVNKDFVFVIKDEVKDVILFMGRVSDPVGEND